MTKQKIEQDPRPEVSHLPVVGWLFSRIVVLASVLMWRVGVDWRARRPLFTRATAHVSIVVVALTVIALAGVEPAGGAVGAGLLQPPDPPAEGEASLPQYLPWRSDPLPVLGRLALPHTTIPERPRLSVITYTVQSGDTVFGIAEQFGLTPHTIYWANSAVLQDNPHLLWPGMDLSILPVNGVYHVVSEGETVASVAEQYGVDPAVLRNEWNGLERGQPLQAGMRLVIPGGTREFMVWQLPQYSDLHGAAAAGSGVCAPPLTGLRGNGWFLWPTAGRRISGWIFHDPRNPPHAGLDIGLHTGDSIFAADNGAVVYAGWNDWGYGYLVVLDHGNGFQTYYGHLSAIWVTCGQSVYQGAAIGAGGSTGRSSGPHLHFEIRYEGIPQDPLYYLP